MAQSLKEPLIGAWELVSYTEKPVDGSAPFYPMSEKPKGMILYTPEGYMSAQLMHPIERILLQENGSMARMRSTNRRHLHTLPILAPIM